MAMTPEAISAEVLGAKLQDHQELKIAAIFARVFKSSKSLPSVKLFYVQRKQFSVSKEMSDRLATRSTQEEASKFLHLLGNLYYVLSPLATK